MLLLFAWQIESRTSVLTLLSELGFHYRLESHKHCRLLANYVPSIYFMCFEHSLDRDALPYETSS